MRAPPGTGELGGKGRTGKKKQEITEAGNTKRQEKGNARSWGKESWGGQRVGRVWSKK